MKSFFPDKISNNEKIIWLFVLLAALFARLYDLNQYSLSNDEAWHLVVAAQKNLWEVIQYNFTNEVHPPLSPIIWHLMLKVSANDLWLRSASLLCSMLLIPSAYIFGRFYINRNAGIAAALLCAFGTLPIIISSAIRAYPMFMLASLWIAIFAKQYENNSQRKYLIYYLLSCFAAIELHHAAAFIILPFGLLLLHQSFFQKNKKDFVLILLAHLFFAVAVVGYAEILKHYYAFQGNNGFFSKRDSLGSSLNLYLLLFVKIFSYFTPCLTENKYTFTAQGMSLATTLICFFTIAHLIWSKKYRILCIALTPLLAITLADYNGFYPFSPTPRNNLFLTPSILLLYGYFTELVCNHSQKFFDLSKNFAPHKKLYATLKITTALTAIFLTTFYIFQNDFFRKLPEGCEEFLITKSDRNLLLEELRRRKNANNIFISINSDIWKFQFENKGTVKVITPNLAIYEDDEFLIYFSAFPEREKGANGSIAQYHHFLTDLFSYFKSQKKLAEVKNITFFDDGFHHDILSRLNDPTLLKRAEKLLTKKTLKKEERSFLEEFHRFAEEMRNPQNVTDKFYFNDPTFFCGRKIILFTLTADFVKNKILTKPAIDRSTALMF